MAVKDKNKNSLKTLKDLLVLDNEALHSIAPKPFEPSSLSAILSVIAPSFYSQDQLAQIKNFCEQRGVDTSVLTQEAKINSIKRETKKPRKKRMKRVAAATKKIKKSKKKNVISSAAAAAAAAASNAPTPVLPLEFKNKIIELNGTDVAFILQKALSSSDISCSNSRLSLPVSQLKCDFLREAEKEALEERDEKYNLIGLEVMVLDPCLREWTTLKLKKWEMNTGPIYNLCAGWNNLRRKNDMQVGDILNVWTFRTQDKLCFLLHI